MMKLLKLLVATITSLTLLGMAAHAQGTFFGTNPMIFSTGATSLTEAMRIDGSQRISINGAAQDAFNRLQLLTTTANGGNGIGMYAFTTNNSQSTFSFFNSRSGTPGVFSSIHNNDWIGDIEFYGDTGAGFNLGARINAVAEAAFGNPGNGAPTRIEFWTTPVGNINPSSRLRIDNAGNIIQGGVGSLPSIFGDQPTIQVNSSSNVPAGLMSFAAWVNDATTSPGLYFTKSRNASIGTHTAVQNNDSIGFIIADGSDGTSFNHGPAIQIQFLIDGSVSTNIVPGRLVLQTQNTSGSLLEALRIDSAQHLTVGGQGANVSISGANAFVQTVLPANTNAWHFSSVAFGNFSGDAGYSFAKTRGASATAQGALNNNDLIVEFDIYGSDGVAYRPAAQITAAADAAFSSGSAPGRITFATTPSGSTTLAEAMRIDNTGLMTLGFTGGAGSSVHQLLFNDYKNTGNGRPPIVINWTASGYVGIGPATNVADNILRIGRVNNPGTDFATALSVFILASDNFGIIRNGQLTPDTLLSSPAAATLQLGFTDAAAPVAQTLQVQSVVTGTNNTAGADWTIIGSRGTGTGAGGNIIVKTVPAGGSGTSQNTATEALRIANTGNVFYGGNVALDTGLFRAAASVLEINNGTVGTLTGTYIHWGGQARVTSDVTFTSTTTLGTVTGLTVNVAAGRTYTFRAHLLVTDAAAGGVKAAIAGTATATNIIYNGWITEANTIKGQQTTNATALGTTVASATTTNTDGIAVDVEGTITVNAAGTLLVQAAQNTSSGTATTIKRGSTFIVHDMP